jgi:tellurite resistance protein
MAAHHGDVDVIGHGFAGVLLFTALLVAFLLPHLRQPAFHKGLWVLSFPIAAGTNFVIRWLHGAGIAPGEPSAGSCRQRLPRPSP